MNKINRYIGPMLLLIVIALFSIAGCVVHIHHQVNYVYEIFKSYETQLQIND